MPKRVDHQQRRGEIADAVARLAATRGLGEASFREVAAEAGMSVANIQHYFGTKQALLLGTLERQSTVLGARILQQLETAQDAPPLEQIRTVARALMPTDDVSSDAMRVYLSFAASALTDPDLRTTQAFQRGFASIAFFEDRLRAAAAVGDLADSADPAAAAPALLSLILGLSLGVLLDQFDRAHAGTLLDGHLELLSA
ncbi:MAG TPA: TetR family transcriptional regulator C-terminal domain-containing protein [Nitriliruptorales bacterium]